MTGPTTDLAADSPADASFDPCAAPGRRAPRLFVSSPLAADRSVPLDAAQANYLVNVLRLKPHDEVCVFNGIDGEWRAALQATGRKDHALHVTRLTRRQTRAGDVHYLFAPIKSARLDYMAQKATELGAARLVPVITRRTQAQRVNLDRLHANAVEAAEQCGLLWVPEIAAPEKLETALSRLEEERLLVFCDEAAPVQNPVAALRAAARHRPIAVLIGPEGGFDEAERRLLLSRRNHLRLSLGPRIMRADTAAIAALSLVQAVAGDWTDEWAEEP